MFNIIFKGRERTVKLETPIDLYTTEQGSPMNRPLGGGV